MEYRSALQTAEKWADAQNRLTEGKKGKEKLKNETAVFIGR